MNLYRVYFRDKQLSRILPYDKAKLLYDTAEDSIYLFKVTEEKEYRRNK